MKCLLNGTEVTEPQHICIAHMPAGTLFEMDFGNEPQICLRTFDSLVSLTDPNNTWDVNFNKYAKGRVLSSSEVITLQNT